MGDARLIRAASAGPLSAQNPARSPRKAVEPHRRPWTYHPIPPGAPGALARPGRSWQCAPGNFWIRGQI